ncbi:MAG TPA: 4-alpha-glucanotransferase [bacterium]
MTTNDQRPTTNVRALRALARLYDVQTAYTDITGRRRVASVESLLRVLQAMGAPLRQIADAPSALRERTHLLAEELIDPVIVRKEGPPSPLTLRLIRRRVGIELIREDGAAYRWTVTPQRVGPQPVAVPVSLAPGYYTLRVESGPAAAQSTLIVAPRRAFSPGPIEKLWGVFLPLYALRTAKDWGAGDYAALDRLAAWVGTLGGSVVATLPLLPVFLDRPFDPSPYAPVSRRCWNEFYIDVEGTPELSRSPAAQAVLASPAFQRALRRQRRAPLVDYRAQMRDKRRVLELLADVFFTQAPPSRRAALDRFTTAHPAAGDYARFRAVMDRQQRPWSEWPARLRDGNVRRDDYDERARQYHLYAQWAAHEQFTAASTALRRRGGIVYLDLPLGTHAVGYDVWRERDAFAAGVSTGAPPDTFFGQGQNWGSPPLHPERLRRQGYRYYIECVRHHLAHASLLRIDHIMGLHRFFWIPRGMVAADGVYVRYRAREFYAILAVESMRHRAMIVGENLGTVPAYVNAAMRRHGVLQTYVVQYSLRPDAQAPLIPAPADAVASLNTHDMPPFAAFWAGRELRDLRALGQLDAPHAAAEWDRRRATLHHLAAFLSRRGRLRSPATPRRMLRGLLSYLGAGPARIVLVSLEDLWLETAPQNVPGTSDERPNWRRKARFTLHQIRRMRTVIDTLRDLARARRVDT